jgi:hypothetical protein
MHTFCGEYKKKYSYKPLSSCEASIAWSFVLPSIDHKMLSPCWVAVEVLMLLTQ